MSESQFKLSMYAIAIAFTAVFTIIVIPALIENPDIIGAFAAGFVNPFSSGYSSDVIFCWLALFIWVIYEAKTFSIKHGWLCLLLGVIPGVAVGFSLYLVIRHSQLNQSSKNAG